MSTPLISICLPNLNTRPYLEERMVTILEQTVPDWELIVCDSYSNDGSWEFFQKFKNDPRIQLHQVPRAGIYAGWNECLRRTRGEFVYIATSDDTMLPNLLEKMLVPLNRLPEIQFAVCDYEIIDQHGQPTELAAVRKKREFLRQFQTQPSIRNGPAEFILFCCFESTWVTMTTVLFRRALLEMSGLFPTNRKSFGDLEWSLRAVLASDFAFVPGKLATWRVHEAQATSAMWSSTMEKNRMHLTCVNDVLHDPAARVPAFWKTVNDWDNHLLQAPRDEYLDSLGLFRGVLKRDPKQFIRNIGIALLEEPAFLFSQAIHGFPWSDRFNPDRIGICQTLLKQFNANWPPKAVPDGW